MKDRFPTPHGWFTETEQRTYAELVAEAITKTPHPVCLEIGVYAGRSTSCIAPLLNESATLILIDPYTKFRPLRAFHTVHQMLAHYGLHDRTFFIGLPSEHPSIPRTLRSILGDRTLTTAFIDGNHSRPNVINDVLLTLPLLDPNHGLLCGHDYLQRSCPEVAPALHEILGTPHAVADTFWWYGPPPPAILDS